MWLLWLRYPHRLDFVALTVGSVIPDLLEPVFLVGFPQYYWTSRDLSHSLFGVLTYDLVMALLATTFVVRPLIDKLDQVLPSELWNRFGALDFRRPTSRWVTVGSAAIGTISHILADLPFHTVTTILFPGPRLRLYPETYSFLLGSLSAITFGPTFGFLTWALWLRPALQNMGARRHSAR